MSKTKKAKKPVNPSPEAPKQEPVPSAPPIPIALSVELDSFQMEVIAVPDADSGGDRYVSPVVEVEPTEWAAPLNNTPHGWDYFLQSDLLAGAQAGLPKRYGPLNLFFTQYPEEPPAGVLALRRVLTKSDFEGVHRARNRQINYRLVCKGRPCGDEGPNGHSEPTPRPARTRRTTPASCVKLFSFDVNRVTTTRQSIYLREGQLLETSKLPGRLKGPK